MALAVTTAPIIGIMGRSRTGKDTVARILRAAAAARPGPPYAIVRLSAPIKDAARALFAFDDAQIEGPLKEVRDARWGVSPRQVFQTLTEGTMKHMGVDHFTRLLYAHYDAGTLGPRIIIPDIRYEHDVREIHRRGGRVIHVARADLPVRYACEDHLDTMHAQADVCIVNDGTEDDLRRSVMAWLLR